MHVILQASRPILLAALAVLALAAPADAGPAGFGVPVRVGAGPAGGLNLALGPSGDAVLAYDTDAGIAASVRRGPAGAWSRPRSLTARRYLVAQTAAGARGALVVAWASYFGTEGRGRILARVSRTGEGFDPAQDLGPARRDSAANLRMVRLTDGRVLALWRDQRPSKLVGERVVGVGPTSRLRLAILRPGASRFDPARALPVDGAAPAVVATSDGGALAAWVAGVPGRPSRLAAARLAPRAASFGPPFPLATGTRRAVQLAAGPGGAVLAAWLDAKGAALVRQVRPRLGPVSRLAFSGAATIAKAPRIAIGPDGRALAALRAWDAAAGGYAALAATRVGGRWSRLEPLAPASGMVSLPWPAVLGDGSALVAWAQSRREAGAASYDIVIATRGAAGDPWQPAGTLFERFAGRDGAGIAYARSGDALLVAWPNAAVTPGARPGSNPGPADGVLVASRPG